MEKPTGMEQDSRMPYPFPVRETLLEKVFHLLFGYRYYAIITYRVGTFRCGIHENIFWTKKDARKVLGEIYHSFTEMEVVSFRSRYKYNRIYDPKLDVYYYVLAGDGN